MATLSIRTWESGGKKRHAYVVRYTNAAGLRRLRTFTSKDAGETFRQEVEGAHRDRERQARSYVETIVAGESDLERRDFKHIPSDAEDEVIAGEPDQPIPAPPPATRTPKMTRNAIGFLYGAGAIAEALGVTVGVANHLCRVGGPLPCFRIGGKVCARLSTIERWLDEQEVAAANEPMQRTTRGRKTGGR